MVGYSRLVQRDEQGTLERLKAHRKELIEPLVTEHGGRVVKLMGDGILCEFPSAVHAVSCAVAIQRGMAEREKGVAEAEGIRLRIGINVGDVVHESGDIFGDGVNVAARLEAMAEPGGVCIARNVHSQVKDKLAFRFEPMGRHRVKNIAEPVEVWRVAPDEVAPRPAWRRWRHPAVAITAAIILLLIAAGGVGGWWWNRGPGPDQPGNVALSGRPSLVVLPFVDLSGETGQEYFADGITEDLITDLAKLSGLFVIARNSAFTYKGRAVRAQDVADELGVRYVLEGSVRRTAGKVRINAQLVDAATGDHVWAERYDRDQRDIFAVQDEVIGEITSALEVELTATERTRLTRPPTANLEAYDYYLRAEQHVYGGESAPLSAALSFYEKAIALDPGFADAYAGYARAAVDVWQFDYSNVLLGAVARKRAYEAAGRALQLDPDQGRAYTVLGILQVVDRAHDEAIASARKAVALDAGSAEAHLNLALVLTFAGRPAEALASMETVLRLNPKAPRYVHDYHAWVLFMNRRYQEALEALGSEMEGTRGYFAAETLAMTNAELGRLDAAREALAVLYQRWPANNLAYYRVLYAHYRREEDRALHFDALRKAGMPEWPYGHEEREEDRLDGAAIRALAFGRTWNGRTEEGLRFVQEIAPDGTVAFRSPSASMIGMASIEDDRLCLQYPGFLLGRRHCGLVYRHAQEAPGENGQYVYVNVDTIKYFSVAP